MNEQELRKRADNITAEGILRISEKTGKSIDEIIREQIKKFKDRGQMEEHIERLEKPLKNDSDS
ncbi:MAG: hypothetical protein UR39_C0002G0143 [Candidatus Woesebacteria bacterium GW2011_GWA1_33_30]|uniref:Ribbon-helix-helix protein CopG domain-containing protein n=1 Tax=Candidatus Woesebacteria bacterium GW2011_GWA2_33_28 TaxID=1618561 RepID=A0A0G0CA24_9BACT|nr:MAG: hypothetical protein UR38_C0002G0143 [Candidatus Woesebacteria bacterium GW2011_GWA2_33_28]KKP48853.1 MAG: hypothetical protein UR39_C0002G0143 [Candidatus Woesebacteria bacterium GW2011_GWA1_33_30]KKP50126.1 MAG: hypothetical protein UR40_C0002G0143 [Microgenomates group bacterium GW2011_GWC1_33_32]KKP51896.1 MAG: hypothetical protein UR44_C0006G0142 [Candidatus Woesebacteria bacterium GW2011_GWB1_33_38]KKP57395.1 MAG: hypothetical protein UR48_C0018G0013 [Microgenomates group bacteriu